MNTRVINKDIDSVSHVAICICLNSVNTQIRANRCDKNYVSKWGKFEHDNGRLGRDQKRSVILAFDILVLTRVNQPICDVAYILLWEPSKQLMLYMLQFAQICMFTVYGNDSIPTSSNTNRIIIIVTVINIIDN